ncbi:MAG: hypothetical protein II719_02225, partial [Clostridia bacterium]|nr:hypothetical protein [Clostridia bacterium]
NSEHPELAEIYINYMLSEEPAVANAEYTYYATPNLLVTENEEYQEAMAEVKENAMELLYGEQEGYLKTSYRNLDPDGLQMLNDLWEELKIESSISTSIYIICLVIILVIVAWIVFLLIRKKKRNIY